MKQRVFIAHSGRNSAYAAMFRRRGWEVVDDITEADLIQFTGGPDVTPSLYGEIEHPLSRTDRKRDIIEALMFRYAVKRSIPMAGICRGAQLLNVLSGGSMFQHVNNHVNAAGHEVIDEVDGVVFQASSLHHQMMVPTHDAFIIGKAAVSTERHIMGPHGQAIFRRSGKFKDDVEVAVYWEPLALCFQPHPEKVHFPECTDAYFKYLREYIMPSPQ